MWNLLGNKMYMFITATITVVLFSATGLQFWTISYMVVVMEIRPSTAQVWFVLTTISAPIPGALFGSSLADSYVSRLTFLT